MEEDDLAQKAIEDAEHGQYAYCKFLSANDSGETGGHQVGILLSNSAKSMFFDPEAYQEHIAKRAVNVLWQNDFSTESSLTWYESKKELRLTRFGRGFELLRPEYTGALFVLTCGADREAYKAYLLNTDESITSFLAAFGLTPADTNAPIESGIHHARDREQELLHEYAVRFNGFPTSSEMSLTARAIFYSASLAGLYRDQTQAVLRKPDQILVDWTKEEYRLFRTIEEVQYGDTVRAGFPTVDEFVIKANEVLNRRKSRAGKSLEHHLEAIFDANRLLYTSQGVTEGRKRPDFVFPSIDDYHNMSFPVDQICTLAAKTTCKDRWRQVLNESDRLKGRTLYLCTMQQGISSQQLDEMTAEHVQLVVPQTYISTYPVEYRNHIWTLNKFVGYVHELENV